MGVSTTWAPILSFEPLFWVTQGGGALVTAGSSTLSVPVRPVSSSTISTTTTAGSFQNTLPTATNEVGNLFPAINNLPQIAASTFGSGGSSSSGSSGDGLLDNFVDNLAGAIAQASLG